MWATLIPIIAKYGFDVAESLWAKWQSGKDPTAQDWIELRAMNDKEPKSYLLEAAKRAGLTESDPTVQALLKQL